MVPGLVHGTYPGGIALDPQGPATGSSRVIRGGYWATGARSRRDCRSADRVSSRPGRQERPSSVSGFCWPQVSRERERSGGAARRRLAANHGGTRPGVNNEGESPRSSGFRCLAAAGTRLISGWLGPSTGAFSFGCPSRKSRDSPNKRLSHQTFVYLFIDDHPPLDAL